MKTEGGVAVEAGGFVVAYEGQAAHDPHRAVFVVAPFVAQAGQNRFATFEIVIRGLLQQYAGGVSRGCDGVGGHGRLAAAGCVGEADVEEVVLLVGDDVLFQVFQVGNAVGNLPDDVFISLDHHRRHYIVEAAARVAHECA